MSQQCLAAQEEANTGGCQYAKEVGSGGCAYANNEDFNVLNAVS